MKPKISELDKIDLVIDPRPMTDEEKSALEKYIRNDQAAQKYKRKKRKQAA